MNIVFVCTGNTCRSPMAEGIAKDALAKLPQGEKVHVTSAGLAANEGDAATPHSVKVCADHGIDISQHQSKPLTMTLLAAADKIITMTHGQAMALHRFMPERAEDVIPLHADFDVSDPFGGTEGLYESCFIQIQEGILNHLTEWIEEDNQ